MKKQLLPLFFLLSVLSSLAQNDAAGCEDHPLISRYPGAELAWCETMAFNEYHVAVGPQTGYRTIDDWVDLEGKVYRLYYRITDGATMSEVYQNYRNAIQRAGFEMIAQGLHPERNVGKEVGGNTWMGTAFARNPIPTGSGVKLFQGSPTSAGMGYVAGRLSRPTGDVYAVLAAYQYSSEETVVLLDLIEEAPLDDGKVTVDIDYLARELETKGAVALYGIYFDFDQAVVKPESAETLEVIADLLKRDAQLQLYVVGHTDMKGALDYNLSLSERRARAVVDKLVSDYGIAAGRLEGQGVGPLSPRSANTSDGGRSKNRRVELVRKM